MDESIYRDALAVELGGETEASAGSGRVDIVVRGDESEGTPDLLVEVKSADDLIKALGQWVSYPLRWHRPCQFRIHLILSANRLTRNRQLKLIDEHRPVFDGKVKLSTVVERLDLPNSYKILGHEVTRQAPFSEIRALVDQVRNDSLDVGGLTAEAQSLLLELARAWRSDVLRVSVGEFRSGIVVYGHRASHLQPSVVPVNDAIRAWLRREHYRWLSVPMCVGVSPE